MQEKRNRRIVLAARPQGEPRDEDFRLEAVDLASPGHDQVLLRTIYLSLDPYMRGRMNAGPSYAPPVEVGQVMEGGTISAVVESRSPAFARRHRSRLHGVAGVRGGASRFSAKARSGSRSGL